MLFYFIYKATFSRYFEMPVYLNKRFGSPIRVRLTTLKLGKQKCHINHQVEKHKKLKAVKDDFENFF